MFVQKEVNSKVHLVYLSAPEVTLPLVLGFKTKIGYVQKNKLGGGGVGKKDTFPLYILLVCLLNFEPQKCSISSTINSLC